jgi:[acyl-carrier-protein] S-malonyltransferase
LRPRLSLFLVAQYQNVTAAAVSSPEEIKKNLIIQLTAPVKWTQSVQQMIADGATLFTEVGPEKY